jgi:uncharacterized protein YutE (UPF0331/DUF86 family)
MKARVQHLRERLAALHSLAQNSREAYLRDANLQAAAERHFQVAIECCLDIAKYAILARGLQAPEQVRDVFKTLSQAELLPEDFAKTLTALAALRNRLVHVYLTIEPDKMYAYLQDDLVHFERFIGLAASLIEASGTPPPL